MKKIISIIAPMFNEAGLVSLYVNEIKKVANEIKDNYRVELILVDDGSSDGTLSIIQEEQKKAPELITLVSHSRNFGKEASMYAGLKYSKGDYVTIMDADLQDPPELIIKLLDKAEEGYDVVNATRSSRQNDIFYKRVTAAIYYWILGRLQGKLKVDFNAANYRLLSRKIVNELLKLSECNPTFRISVPFLGFKTTNVNYSRNKRESGESKYNFISLIRCALDGVTSLSIAPLELFFKILPIEFFAFIISLISIFFVSKDNTIYSIVLTAVFFTIFFISVLLAIIAEYIGQIMIEIKHRPTSIIAQYIPANIINKDDN